MPPCAPPEGRTAGARLRTLRAPLGTHILAACCGSRFEIVFVVSKNASNKCDPRSSTLRRSVFRRLRAAERRFRAERPKKTSRPFRRLVKLYSFPPYYTRRLAKAAQARSSAEHLTPPCDGSRRVYPRRNAAFGRDARKKQAAYKMAACQAVFLPTLLHP